MKRGFTPCRVRVADVELREHVTRRERHLGEVCDVPRAEDDPAIVGTVLQLPHDLLDLVDALTVVIRMAVLVLGAKVPPLEAVHGAEIAFLALCKPQLVQELARPVAVPDVDSGVRQRLRRRAPRHEPQEFGGDGAEEDSFGRQQREHRDAFCGWRCGIRFREAEPQLGRRKQRERACSCPVRSVFSPREDIADEI